VLHSRVARSQIAALTTLGVPEVRVIGTEDPAAPDVENMGVRVFHNMEEGIKDVDVVMMLRLQNERMRGALLPSPPGVLQALGPDPEKLALAKDAIVLHPGPMNRGVEIDSAVADGMPVRDPAPGHLRHRRAHGGDEHARQRANWERT
jgi:aspartate carbamoyltransferase catalytic subunit